MHANGYPFGEFLPRTVEANRTPEPSQRGLEGVVGLNADIGRRRLQVVSVFVKDFLDSDTEDLLQSHAGLRSDLDSQKRSFGRLVHRHVTLRGAHETLQHTNA